MGVARGDSALDPQFLSCYGEAAHISPQGSHMTSPLKVVGEIAYDTRALSAHTKLAERGAAAAVISSPNLADVVRAGASHESTAVSITDAEPTSASESPAASDSSTIGDSVTTGSGHDAFSDAAVIVAETNLAADDTLAPAGSVMIAAGFGQAADIIFDPVAVSLDSTVVA